MSAVKAFTKTAAEAIYDAIARANSPLELDAAARAIWREYGNASFGEEEAAAMQSLIDMRRRPSRDAADRKARQFCSRFVPRQRPRSPDRKASRDRRRMLGGSAVLPPKLREHYTEGQRAVLAIIAGEIKHHGVCDLPIDKIAALAGVCRTTVQNALHEARRLHHLKITERPRQGQKNLTNIIEIVSGEWITWIRRGPAAHRPIGSKFAKILSATKSRELKDIHYASQEHGPERSKKALRGGPGPRSRPK